MVRSKEEKAVFKKINFLKSINYIRLMIESRERCLNADEYKKSQVKAIDYAKEQIKGGNKNSWESLIDKTDEHKRYIVEKNMEYLNLKLEVMKSIDQINDVELRLLLQLRYVECLDWNKVEHIMDISQSTRANKHSKALEKIYITNLYKKYGEV